MSKKGKTWGKLDVKPYGYSDRLIIETRAEVGDTENNYKAMQNMAKAISLSASRIAERDIEFEFRKKYGIF